MKVEHSGTSGETYETRDYEKRPGLHQYMGNLDAMTRKCIHMYQSSQDQGSYKGGISVTKASPW